MFYYDIKIIKYYVLSRPRRSMHTRKLDINVNSVNKLRKYFLENSSSPTIHPLANFAISDQALMEVLQDQLMGLKKPRIKVAKHKIATKFISDMQVFSKTSLNSLVGVQISADQYKVHYYLREEILNNFGYYTLNSNFQNILENYGASFEIDSKLFEAYGIIGTKLCRSIEKSSTIKGFFCDPTFKINTFFLGLLASNCLLGTFLFGVDLTILTNYNDLLLHMLRQLEMIKVCYEHYGVTVSLLTMNTDVLPSVEILRTPFASIIEVVSSVSETVPLIPDHLYTNRLIFKKIPFVGDLVFQVIDYYCRSSNFLSIAPFIERTVDLTIRYSLQIGHSFHMFSNLHYINSDGLSSSPGDDGGGGDGSDKNPNFNRKFKVIALFGLIVGIARFFGSN